MMIHLLIPLQEEYSGSTVLMQFWIPKEKKDNFYARDFGDNSNIIDEVEVYEDKVNENKPVQRKLKF